MACAHDNLAFPRQPMEADVCLVDHVPSRSRHGGNVNIREFEDSVVNPDPVIHNEDTEQLMEDYLSPQKLKNLTGIQDLHEVLFLEMVVDTTESSLGNFGNMVKNLKQLKLSNSVITSVRDIGTCLDNLQTLWMARCGLSDLDGISSLCSIKELYLAYNDITDVSPISMLDNLEILDLEGNLVDDMAQVEFLVLCPELKRLTLEGNPVCTKPHADSSPESLVDYNYRVELHKALPKLTHLDDEPFLFDLVNGTRVLKITPTQEQNKSVREKLKSDWELVTERIKAFDLEEQSTEVSGEGCNGPGTSRGNRPMSASRQRPTTASKRPSTARPRPSTARQRPSTVSGARPGSGGSRPSTAMGERDVFEEDDNCSDLTHGSGAVICGNPSRALKARRKKLNTGETNILVVDMAPATTTTPDKLESHDNYCERDLFEELKSWRREYARFLDKHSENMIIEDEEDCSEDDINGSYVDKGSNNSPPSLSPTPPQRPISSSPPSSASRRRVARVRKSYPVPLDDPNQRPQTAADFRDPVRHSSSDARLRSSPEERANPGRQNSKEGPRGHSAPVQLSSPRSLPSLKNNGNSPVISASKELYKRSSVDPRLVRRLRPATARPAPVKNHKWV